MIADIITVASKELREMFTFGDVRGRSKFSLLVLIVIFGIIIPLQNGREWIDSPVNIMVWGWMPFLWVPRGAGHGRRRRPGGGDDGWKRMT